MKIEWNEKCIVGGMMFQFQEIRLKHNEIKINK